MSFFNKSLLELINLLEIKITSEHLGILEKGKKLRSNFNLNDLDYIILYNQVECITAEKIAGKIWKLLVESEYIDRKGNRKNLTVKNFYGSSSIAGKILKDYKIKNDYKKYEDIFLKAYYGGRFEIFRSGEFTDVHKYDINSAYPFVLKYLKKVKGFKKIKKVKEIKDEGIYYIYYKHLYNRTFICPFPLRIKTNRIIYAGEVEGFYYGCEINALINNVNSENYILMIKYGYEPVLGSFLFENKNGYNVVDELYTQRNFYKQKKDLRHYIYKITLNSLYGKLAQKVGSKTYANYYYAGYVTAKTRSILLNELYKMNDRDILSVATDSIFSLQKIPRINIGKNIGQWTYEKLNKCNILMSGVYSAITENNTEVYGLRGFKISLKEFDNYVNEIKKQGKATVLFNQFITHKLYLANLNAYQNKRLNFITITKIINPKKANFKRIYKYIDNINSRYSYYKIVKPIISEPMKLPEIIEDNIFIDY